MKKKVAPVTLRLNERTLRHLQTPAPARVRRANDDFDVSDVDLDGPTPEPASW